MTKLFESIKKISSQLTQIDENTDISEIHRLTGLLYEKLSFIKHLKTSSNLDEFEIFKKSKIDLEKLTPKEKQDNNIDDNNVKDNPKLTETAPFNSNNNQENSSNQSFISEIKHNPLKFELIQDNIEMGHSQKSNKKSDSKISKKNNSDYYNAIKKPHKFKEKDLNISTPTSEKKHIGTYDIHEAKNTLDSKDDLVYQEAIRIINKTPNTQNSSTTHKEDDLLKKETLEDLLSDYIAEPVFVRREHAKPETFKELYKKNLDIPVSDKLRFIRNLFDDNIEDYLKVITRIQKMASFQEIRAYINEHVKPGFNRWEGKEDYEKDFLNVIEKKFY